MPTSSATTASATQTATPLYWTYHIHLSAVNNVHWQPPDGDIEFNANLDLEQTPEALVIYGDGHLLRVIPDSLAGSLESTVPTELFTIWMHTSADLTTL